MKTEIDAKTYQTYYVATNFNVSAFEEALKLLGYDVGNLTVKGSLEFGNSKIRRLVGIKKVIGGLWLINTPIEDLGILEEVGGNLWMENTPIESLGNLRKVGGFFDLRNTPISKKYSEEEIKQMVRVGGHIYL